MANKLEGTWRSFVVIDDADPEELTTPDGIFEIKEVDDRGMISGYHEVGEDRKEVYGQVVPLGPALSIVMEYQAHTEPETKRYIGYLVIDEEEKHTYMIVGKKATYQSDEQKAAPAVASRAPVASADGQEDGTVIITKP